MIGSALKKWGFVYATDWIFLKQKIFLSNYFNEVESTVVEEDSDKLEK